MTEQEDIKFLELAKSITHLSPDPSTQVGALIVAKAGHVLSSGFNHIPPEMDQLYDDREEKLNRVVHAETHAINNAARSGRSTEGCTMYISLKPCHKCMTSAHVAGITRIVTYTPDAERAERWSDAFAKTDAYIKELGIEYLEKENNG